MNTIEATKVSQFTYLLDKIASAEFRQEPFKHLEIFDFLSEEHFNAVINASQIAIAKANDTKSLIDTLIEQGYEIIAFPGCTTSVKAYLKWLKGQSGYTNVETCEGFGLAFRLKTPQNNILKQLREFFHSEEFKNTLREKFNITRPTKYDAGLQKYLQGYEISPHPDIRSKALTYMLNVNPSVNSEDLDIHTHYLTLKPKKRFIGEFWRYNEDYDRCWVPWEWCDTVKQQTKNNSIVIFAPSWDTLHAVKLNYDHLATQRTQYYGNLWYTDMPTQGPMPDYQQFEIQGRLKPQPGSETTLQMLKRYAKSLIRLG
ncbi:hypothetical protein [Gloeothece verrucosa]|uniref:Prolyl 4-hydroxylase alpha subunit Fe(2+) 2OG dioxygenase domain-containing protein n=1 Tax=Gloeothece verrucosa (strain PCC 7822) TaxID=497965 RepID=E0UE82_GLOV7|nr:hypothetical protein [Gloeothece verrucosa]ADN14207.1 hypothetical protein Cyan7822_2228 [Gloeothece verrucosa PCC 7822]